MPLHHYVCGDFGSTILQALCCILSVLVGLKEKERKPAWLQQKSSFGGIFLLAAICAALSKLNNISK